MDNLVQWLSDLFGGNKPQQPLVSPLKTPAPTATPDPMEQALTKKGWKKGTNGTFYMGTDPSAPGAAGAVASAVPASTPVPMSGYEKVVKQVVPQDAQPDMVNLLGQLSDAGYSSPEALAYALSTVNSETAGKFKPVREGYYADDQNGGPGTTGSIMAQENGYDGGAPYYGRGYIQLTGKGNYQNYGKQIGVPDLADNPDQALDPDTSTKLFVQYWKNHPELQNDIKSGNLTGARQQINGGTNSLDTVNSNYSQYLKAIKNLSGTIQGGR